MKSQPRRILVAAAGLLAGLTFALGSYAEFSLSKTLAVEFQAVGPAGLKIDGSGSSLTVTEKDGKVVFVAGLGDLKTGIKKRDEHLKETLAVDKHKQAKLVVDRSKLKLPGEGEALKDQKVSAQFTLHGTEKTVPVSYDVKRNGSNYAVVGRTTVNIEEFGIKKPCYLGVCVKPDVKIEVKAVLQDK